MHWWFIMRDATDNYIHRYVNLLYYKQCSLLHVSATYCGHLQGGVLEDGCNRWPKICSRLHYLWHNKFTYMYIDLLAASLVMTYCIFQQHKMLQSGHYIDYRFEHSVSKSLGPGRLLRVYIPVQILTVHTENVGSCTNSPADCLHLSYVTIRYGLPTPMDPRTPDRGLGTLHCLSNVSYKEVMLYLIFLPFLQNLFSRIRYSVVKIAFGLPQH
jgi:hypothetical protein